MKKILINSESWQTRVAVLDGNQLRDLALETPERPELEKSFFKGKILKVLPGIQTAFVDIGQQRSGFLHVTEVDRVLATERIFESQDSGADKKSKREVINAMNIGKIFSEGDEVLIQVTKEPVFEKGAKLTTCYTLPGKFLVLMPNIPQIGISRKIESKEERTRLKELISGALSDGMGAIVRTTAEGRSDKDIKRDLAYLLSKWEEINKVYEQSKAGEKVYGDISISLRAVREHLEEDTEVVVCDRSSTANEVRSFIRQFMPEQVSKVQLYQGAQPLFDKFDVESQIDELLQRKVHLKSGGTLIIESTEAMTVIDVNTGRFVGKKKSNLEDTILKTNLEAAEEVVRQLRLRNIGGLIVIDFIDMMHAPNRQKLSSLLEKTLKEKDKLQSVALKVSEFGLVQMTRKRSGRTLSQQLTHECPTCHSNGFVKSPATLSYELFRGFKRDMSETKVTGTVTIQVPVEQFDYLTGSSFGTLLALEKLYKIRIILERNSQLIGSHFKLVFGS
ncbi:Rne/Rng family ribonuclease [Candidatus Babeliales bacterium]|nr:Rne/Rng family ribonuclease [Candidatus Babeliales bacterium]